MSISVLYPWFLLLLLAIPLLWFYPHPIEDRTHGILRSLLAAAVILALARPVLLTDDGEVFQVLILDDSASLDDRQRAEGREVAQRWAKQVADRGKAAVILLGPAEDNSDVDAFEGISTLVRVGGGDNGSPLGTALAAAERHIPDGSVGAVTVVSDGLATDRRWGPAVQRLTRRGITVNTAQLAPRSDDVYPAGLYAEELLRAGETTRVDVQVAGVGTGLRVRLADSQGRQLGLSQPVDSTGAVSVPVEFEPREPGFITVHAEVLSPEGVDSDASNNVFAQTLAVQPPLRMLYLGERMMNGAARLRELIGGGFEIEDGSDLDLSVVPDLDPYDLVMVDDRTAARMPEAFQRHLSAAVRDRGLGLLFSGGKSAFGAGGYDGSTLARALPVDLEQKTEKRDPSTALALIIDTSGSMGGNRMEVAKQVARLAVRRLKAHDRIGIVEFYGNKHWALPLQSAANKISIDRAIGRMQPIGGTVLYPAIEEAYYGLKSQATRYKHIIIITDAGIEEGNYEALVRKLAKQNINLSTVLVGAQAHNQSLIDMASWGNGRFYSAADRYSLPEVVLKQPSTMKLPAYKEGDFPVAARGAEGWWGAIDRGALPPLSGYVESSARPGAEVVVEVAGSSQPIVASWQYGLGRVTALMTEPVGPGTHAWREWSDYGRLFARLAERTADGSQAFRYAISREDRVITLTARRYKRIPSLHPHAILLDSRGAETNQPVEFRQLAPGYFAAQWTADPAEAVNISAGMRDIADAAPARGGLRLVSMASADVVDERQVDPLLSLDLAALAGATSGSVIDPVRPRADEFAVPAAGQGSLKLYPVWWYALLLGLLLFIAELFYRRSTRT